MLHAIARNKMAEWELENGEKISAAQAYRDIEDHLTAAVFARLSYLPTELFWRLITHGKKDEVSPSFSSTRPRLKNIHFWPIFDTNEETEEAGESAEQRNEPDVVIECQGLTVIVESKRRDFGTVQDANQIRRYVNACWRESDCSQFCVLLMGGAPESVSKVQNQLAEEWKASAQPSVEIISISWRALLTAVKRLAKTIPQDIGSDHLRRVLEDIALALELHGVVNWQYLNALRSLGRVYDVRMRAALGVLAKRDPIPTGDKA